MQQTGVYIHTIYTSGKIDHFSLYFMLWFLALKFSYTKNFSGPLRLSIPGKERTLIRFCTDSLAQLRFRNLYIFKHNFYDEYVSAKPTVSYANISIFYIVYAKQTKKHIFIFKLL